MYIQHQHQHQHQLQHQHQYQYQREHEHKNQSIGESNYPRPLSAPFLFRTSHSQAGSTKLPQASAVLY